MKVPRNFTRGLAAAGFAGMLSTGLLAATATTTFDVTATVADSCSVSATNLAFGSITPVDNVNFDDTTTITVTCSNGTTYDIGIDAGSNSTDVTARQMDDGGTNFLDYELYQDSGRTTNWGNTVGTDTVAGTGDGTDQSHTVYGRVPSGQTTVPTGSYSDTVTVTVTF